VNQPRKTQPAAVDYGMLSEFVGYAMRRAQVHMYQDFFRVVAPFDIRPAQLAVLIVIERNPGLKQSEVATALNIKRTNFVGLLDTLESRGLAERRAVARDRRSYALYLTAEGEALIRKLKPIIKAHEERLLAGLGEDGRRQLMSLLRRIVSDTPETGAAKTANGTRIKAGKDARSPRLGSAGT
jgi:DNA-binding MarR family transcriptional regulator